MPWRDLLRTLVAFGFVLGSASLYGQQWGTHPDGAKLTELAPSDTPAVVLFFVATDCPVSNRMFPEMLRLRDRFRSRGVRFWFVYPNSGEQTDAITAHQRSFDPGGDALSEALQDPAGSLVRLSRAVATPEMAVLIPSPHGWRNVYTGRIDNRFVRLGQERPAATEHYGEDAIASVLAGRQPKPPVGAPVGCAIMNPGTR